MLLRCETIRILSNILNILSVIIFFSYSGQKPLSKVIPPTCKCSLIKTNQTNKTLSSFRNQCQMGYVFKNYYWGFYFKIIHKNLGHFFIIRALRHQSAMLTNIFNLGLRSDVTALFPLSLWLFSFPNGSWLNFISLKTFLVLSSVIISNSGLIVCPLLHKNLLERSCVFLFVIYLSYTEHGTELNP